MLRVVALVSVGLCACSACEGDEALATLETGSLKVELVAETRFTTSSRLPGYLTSSVLRIEREGQSLRVRASCGEPGAELANDGTDNRLAYRCAGGQPWHIVVLAAQTGFAFCGEAAGSDPEPAFDALPADFAGSVAELGACAADWNPVEQRKLFDEVERLGEAALIDLLFETRRVNLWAWRERVEGLSEARRAELAERLVPSLEEDASRDLAPCRAIALAGADDPTLRRVAAARLSEMIGLDDRSGPAQGRATCAPQFERLLRLTSQTDPDAAAASACELLATGGLVRQQGGRRLPKPAFDVGMDVLDGRDCGGVASQLMKLRCDAVLRCADTALCTEEEASTELQNPDLAPARRVALRLLAHAYARSNVPDELLRVDARRQYTVSRDTPGSCTDIPDRALIEQAVCDRSYNPIVPYRCGLAIDDDSQTIRVHHREPGG